MHRSLLCVGLQATGTSKSALNHIFSHHVVGQVQVCRLLGANILPGYTIGGSLMLWEMILLGKLM